MLGGEKTMKNTVDKVDDIVRINHVLISVSDKSGLTDFVNSLVTTCPGVRIMSTGGTYKRIREILGEDTEPTLMQVSDYTGQPETQGGLVKTLDFKIYLGLLTEKYNESHMADLERTGAVQIDMVVANLYPFEQTIARESVTLEEARANIDIGGPTMIRAAAKNYLRVACVVDPRDYGGVISELRAGNGALSLASRFGLAQKAFQHTAAYDKCIADYLAGKACAEIRGSYSIAHNQ